MREIPAQGQIAQDHHVASVFSPRPELGQTFTPPEWVGESAGPRCLVVTLRLQVKLKDVHHLVPHRMTEFRKVSPKWQRHPALQEVSDAEKPLRRREWQDVGLLEVG